MVIHLTMFFLRFALHKGNCGLSVGISKIAMDPIAKFMLVVNMYIGRLEIIPIIAMFVTIFRK
jgi:trk system potassium uptake protein TrkH